MRLMLLLLTLHLGCLFAADEIIIDNNDPGVVRSGTWTATTRAPGFHGADYLQAGSRRSGDTVTYRPTITRPGSYEISIWYPATVARSAAVKVTVGTDLPVDYTTSEEKDPTWGFPIYVNTYVDPPFPSEVYPTWMSIPWNGATHDTAIDQRSRGGQWVSLGEYRLSVGHGTDVTISTDGQYGITVADAVRFRYVRDVEVPLTPRRAIEIDDTDPVRTRFSGTWTVSDKVKPYIGSGYRFAAPGAAPGTQAIYTPYLPIDGVYEVSLSVPAYGGRSPAVPVIIRHRSGNTTIKVDQRTEPGYRVLGRWEFNAGDQASVTIDGSSARGYVIADAVRFRLVSIPADAPLQMPGTIAGKEFDRISLPPPNSSNEKDNPTVQIADDGQGALVIAGSRGDIPPPDLMTASASYTFEVPKSGLYTVEIEKDLVVPRGWNEKFDFVSIWIDDHLETFFLSIDTTSRRMRFQLDAGIHVLVVGMDTGPTWDFYSIPDRFEIHSITITPAEDDREPFQGAPHAVPGILLQAEDYDRGGPGVAYGRQVLYPGPGTYRPDDIGVISLSEGEPPHPEDGYALRVNTYIDYADGWDVLDYPEEAPLWCEYTISCEKADTYDVVMRIREYENITVELAVDGNKLAAPLEFGNTYDDDEFIEATIPGVRLPVGIHRLRLTVKPSKFIKWTLPDIDWLRFDPVLVTPLKDG